MKTIFRFQQRHIFDVTDFVTLFPKLLSNLSQEVRYLTQYYTYFTGMRVKLTNKILKTQN